MSTPRFEADDVVVRALERALRAEMSAQQAHERLDRMNGSIDKLVKEVKSVAQGVSRIDQRLIAEDGVAVGRRQILTPARMLTIALLSPLMSAIFVKVMS